MTDRIERKLCGFTMNAAGNKCGRAFGHGGDCDSAKACPHCRPVRIFRDPLAYDDHIREKHVWEPASDVVATADGPHVDRPGWSTDGAKILPDGRLRLDTFAPIIKKPAEPEAEADLEPEDDPPVSEPTTPWRCVPCDQTFDSPKRLGAHNRHNHPKPPKEPTMRVEVSVTESYPAVIDAPGPDDPAIDHFMRNSGFALPPIDEATEPTAFEPTAPPFDYARANAVIEAAKPSHITEDLFKKLERLMDDASQVMLETRVGVQRNWAEYEPLALRYITILMDRLQQQLDQGNGLDVVIMDRIEKRLYYDA